MKSISLHFSRLLLAVLLLLSCLPFTTTAQQITLNMAPIENSAITPGNIFGYIMHCSKSTKVTVRGNLRYKQTNQSITYTFDYLLSEGLNVINRNAISPSWHYSSPALRELFNDYNILPAGMFEYCVTVAPANTVAETNVNLAEECIYYRGDDYFVINLVDPNDKAVLKEYNPTLTWIATFPTPSSLTYRLKLTEIKQGQTAVNSIVRNQLHYDEKNLISNSLVYPVSARPLIANQPYAWTVDAYYKDVLLGGAETWQFIISDSVTNAGNIDQSYVDIKRESGEVLLTAVGRLKMKYVLDDAKSDSLLMRIVDEANREKKLTPDKLTAIYGDNRYTVDFTESANLKHKHKYMMIITTKTGHEYKLLVQYLNPSF